LLQQRCFAFRTLTGGGGLEGLGGIWVRIHWGTQNAWGELKMHGGNSQIQQKKQKRERAGREVVDLGEESFWDEGTGVGRRSDAALPQKRPSL